jgi:chromosomal replication initiation ATPase DnaA
MTGATLLAGTLLALPPPPRPIAIDDADAASERLLLHVLNTCRETALPVLLAAREAPARWACALPDLASRLRAMPAVQLRPAEEALLRALFDHLARERQMRVAPHLRDWLLLRLPRSQAAVREAVARLDHASLAAGGRVTRGLALAVVASLGGDVTEDEPPVDGGPAGVSAAGRLL